MKTYSKTGRQRGATPGIKPKQELALKKLAEGKALQEVAAETRINRTTLYRWLHEDARFRAAYNEWRQKSEQAARARLIAGGEVAAMSLVAAAAGRQGVTPQTVRAAQILLKALGLMTPQPPGPVHPLNALVEMKIEEKRETNAIGHQIAIEYFDPEELDDVPEGRPKPAPGVGDDDPDAGPNDIVFNGRKLTPEELGEEDEEDDAPKDE